jgi:hypothetical protein
MEPLHHIEGAYTIKLLKYLSTIFAVIFLSQSVVAQWTNTGRPPSRAILCFTIIDSAILAGTDGGLVRSTNNGTSWINIGGGCH